MRRDERARPRPACTCASELARRSRTRIDGYEIRNSPIVITKPLASGDGAVTAFNPNVPVIESFHNSTVALPSTNYSPITLFTPEGRHRTGFLWLRMAMGRCNHQLSDSLPCLLLTTL
ncbi:hypothetical protein EVAR_101085_1 [Eumeta japonica]|uniref:Uncharacterized protein n=1 Tax=Eumeta variegata TaxID=151549 RepID=A0A4C2A8S1_EUMVA|nr:hypothetical protein EVAR_101085_1 [Eumeta japonica]